MYREQIDHLMARLSELSEAGLTGRAPGPKGGVVWFDALKYFPMPDILGALTDWPLFNGRMPVPADIVKACRGIAQRREAIGQHLEGRVLAAVWDGGSSEVAQRELAKIKDILSDCDSQPVAGTWHQIAGNSKMDHKGWAWKILERERNERDGIPDPLGRGRLGSYAKRLAREALGLPWNYPA